MVVLVEMIFAERMFRGFRGRLLGRVLFWRDFWRGPLRFGFSIGRGGNEDFEHVPQCARAQHVTSHIQRAAYGDIRGKDHDKCAKPNQKAPDQPQRKCLVHAAKCDPVYELAQPLLVCFFFMSAVWPCQRAAA